MTSMFKVGLRTPHTSSKVRVERVHILVFTGFSALYCKLEGKLSSFVHKSHLVQHVQSHLAAGVVLAKNCSKIFLLNYFNLPTLLNSQATVVDKGSHFQCIVDPSLVDVTSPRQ